MKQKNQLNGQRALFSCLIFFVALLFINSCKKTDSLLSDPGEQVMGKAKTTEDFFKLPANTAPVLKRIATELEKQNNAKEFITAFAAKDGFPVWGKARIETHKRKTMTESVDEDGDGVEDIVDTIVYIPLIPGFGTAQQYVHGFLKAIITDTVAVEIYRQNDYPIFPFQTSVPSPNVTTAENFAVRMMTMDNDVFGTTLFRMEDKRMFHNSTDYSDTANIQRYVKLTNASGEGFSNGTTINGYAYEVCYTVVTYTNICNTVTGSNTSNTQTCWIDTYWNLCITYETENGGGGGSGGNSGGWPFPPGGGGGGGGNPPGGGGGPPCPYFGAPIINSVVPVQCEVGPGGNPWPTASQSAEPDPTIGNDHPDVIWWNETQTNYPPQLLPSWSSMNANYPKNPDGTELCGAGVYALVGGQVLASMPPGGSPNACAIRVSRALNYSGVNIPVIAGQTYQGADGKNYFLSSAMLFNFMKKTFKIPPNAAGSIETFTKAQIAAAGTNFPAMLAGKKGIYMMQASYPGLFEALGHASLYNGTSCVNNTCNGFRDGCYFDAEGGIEGITLFKLN